MLLCIYAFAKFEYIKSYALKRSNDTKLGITVEVWTHHPTVSIRSPGLLLVHLHHIQQRTYCTKPR
jgi:hypothetical protein